MRFVSDWLYLVAYPKDAFSPFIDTFFAERGVGTHFTRFEQHPVIEIKLLVDAGLFAPFGPSAITIHHHIPYRVTHCVRGGSLFVEFIVEQRYRSQLIELDYSSARFGGRIRFMCPETSQLCTKLHLRGDTFVSRRAHWRISVREGSPRQRRYERAARLRDRLLGRDGKGPARGAKRGRILLELYHTDFAVEAWPDLRWIFLEHLDNIIRKRGQPVPSERPGPKSTAAALAAGAPLTPGEDIDWLPHVAEGRLPDLSEPGEKQVLEDHFGLDLNTLLAVSRNGSNDLWAHSLVWQIDQGTVELALIVKWAQLQLQITDRRSTILSPGTQRITLIRSPHGRFRICCPISGQPCDVLFLRDGRFASRTAQNLEYRSQIGRRRIRRSRARPVAPTGEPTQSASKRWEQTLRELNRPIPVPADAPPYVMARLQMWNLTLRGNRDAILYFLRESRYGWQEMERPEILAGYDEIEFVEELKAAEAGTLFDTRGMKIPRQDRR